VSNVIFSVMLGIVFVYFVWLFRKKKEQDYKKNIDKQIVESIRIFRNVILSGSRYCRL
jgi:asparagine N-glycosylation enzyme membrane subunit Stt3